MRNFTSFLCTLFLCICTMQLNAQIINENFNSSPWESAKAATSVSEVTTDNGIWRVYNTEINIEQTGASPATNGALIFPKNSLTPNLDTRPYVDVPAIEKGGVKTIELLARYGGKASIYSQLEVQQLINQEWVKIGETSIDENNYNKPTRYIINVNDLSEDIRLRLYYNGDNASAAVRIHDVIVHAPSLGIAMNLEARNIQEDGFEIQWEHAMLANNYEIVVSKRNSIENAELIVNGDAELSEDATWIFTNAEISSDKKYQGNNAFYLSSTTSYAGILQKVSVEPGTTITINAKGFVTENTTGSGTPIEYTSELRLWGQFLNAESENIENVRIVGLNECKEPSTNWFDIKLDNLTVPNDASILDLDFRAQPGVKAHLDNISVIGSKVTRESISETPLTTTQNSFSISDLIPDQEYSVYVYSIKDDEKTKSAELVVKTNKSTGINSSIENKVILYLENGVLSATNVETGQNVYIVNSLGQMVHQFKVSDSSFRIELPKGFYLVKIDSVVYKINNPH